MKWLSASYWLVESRLQGVRDTRAPDTLKWSHKEPAFKAWRTSESGTKENVLWIRGGPAIGKSTMAGYFIDELKRQYRNAIVAYFFCGREEPGLTDVRDVIRTIAYQCTIRSPIACSVLNHLMDGMFDIEQRVSVHLMITKLLEEPLKEAPEDVYIVIDGLDELGQNLSREGESNSETGANRVKERNELIRYLGELVTNRPSSSRPAVRLLLLSRPEVEVQRLIPSSVLWPLDYGGNELDIQLYVKQELQKHDSEMHNWFATAGVDPFEYFRSHSKGLFLWASTVLEQLAAVTFEESFAQLLEQFSEASGDMDKLYIDIFARIPEKDKGWIGEILKWLLLAQRLMDISELQVAVECDMGKHFIRSKFRSFLDIECGSLVRCLSLDEGPTYAFLIHETLTSLLLDQSKCPRGFFVNIFVACTDVACTCLKILCHEGAEDNTFYDYSARFWTNYLVFAPAYGSNADTLLIYIYRLFKSPHFARWIKFGMLPNDSFSGDLPIDIEEESLESLVDWVRGWTQFKVSQSKVVNTGSELDEAIRWAIEMGGASGAEKFGEYIGKTAARLWISGDHANHEYTKSAFRLALKYYWKREGRSARRFEELRELSTTRFRPLMVWAGIPVQNPSTVSKLSLAGAYFAIRQWDEAIAFYKLAVRADDSNIEVWQFVASAYRERGKFDGAAEFFQGMVEKFSSDTFARYSLAEAYLEAREFDKAIEVYQAIIEIEPELRAWLSLAAVYERRGDYDGAIRVYKSASEMDSTAPNWSRDEVQSVLLMSVGEAYISKRDFDEALKVCQTLLAKEPNNTRARDGMGKVYESKSRHQEAVAVYETWIEENPLSEEGWIGLIDLYKKRKDYDGAIKAYKAWHEKDSNNERAVQGLGQLYHSIGEFEKAIQCYASVENPSWNENGWKYFGRSYVAMGEVDKAINLYEAVLKKMPQATPVWLDLVEAHKKNNDLVGAAAEVERAIKIYEELLDRDPTKSQVLTELAMIYYAKGDYDQAIRMYRTALEIEPYNIAWLRDLAHVYRGKGNLVEAIKLYEQSVESNPANNWVTRVSDFVHYFVSCDGCGAWPLRGLWHKCATCFDYDLCDSCRNRASDLHPEHDFFTLPSAEWLSQLELTENL